MASVISYFRRGLEVIRSIRTPSNSVNQAFQDEVPKQWISLNDDFRSASGGTVLRAGFGEIDPGVPCTNPSAMQRSSGYVGVLMLQRDLQPHEDIEVLLGQAGYEKHPSLGDLIRYVGFHREQELYVYRPLMTLGTPWKNQDGEPCCSRVESWPSEGKLILREYPLKEGWRAGDRFLVRPPPSK